MQITNRKIGIAALGAAGVLALGAGVPALASSTDSTPSPSATDDRRQQFEEHRAAAEQDFAKRLADELGVDADKVAAALEKVRGEMESERQAEHLSALKDRLDQAVEDGGLTQKQADAILEAAKNGVFPGRGGPGGLLGPGGIGHGGMGHGGFGPGGFGRGGFGPWDERSDDTGGSATEGTSTGFARI